MRIQALVATLMLGGMSCAYAQDGPSEKMRGPDGGAPSMQESDRGSQATTSSQGEEKSGQNERQEGPKARSAEKSDSRSGQSEERGSKGRSAEEKSDVKQQRATKTDEGSESRQSRTDDAKNATDKSAKQNDESDTSNKSAGDTREQPDGKTGDAGTNDAQKKSAAQKTAGDKASPDSAKRVDLTGDKRTRVQTAFKSVGDVKHRTHVDIHISVGTRLPRDWDFVPVPVAVLDVVPEYRGYVFAYVDDQYVICDPDSYEVVAVLPAERGCAGASSGRGDKCSTQLSLNSDTRKLILQSVRGGREIDVPDLSVGRSVPRDVQLLTFPDSVISEAQELGSCRYFDAGDQIAIVDPDADKIVLVIDKS